MRRMNMKATVGRIVYYKAYGTSNGEYKSADRASVITEVISDTVVSLCVLNPSGQFFIQNVKQGSEVGQWDWMPFQKGQAQKTEELEAKPVGKDLGITEVRGAKANISDQVIYGDGDTFALLCKASSQAQGWMKSTKVCNMEIGCLVQVTTQQRNPDGSYAVAEALQYVPGMMIDTSCNPRRLRYIQ
jgi:hypothetical protein